MIAGRWNNIECHFLVRLNKIGRICDEMSSRTSGSSRGCCLSETGKQTAQEERNEVVKRLTVRSPKKQRQKLEQLSRIMAGRVGQVYAQDVMRLQKAELHALRRKLDQVDKNGVLTNLGRMGNGPISHVKIQREEENGVAKHGRGAGLALTL